MSFAGFDVTDIKSAIKKAKAAVYNYTELEMKVRDATSNEAWGAASTDLLQIAKATFDYQGFNEVMAAIQRRMTEETRTWRNIYKSLTLIEYLLKNGSDRVVEYWRTNTYLIKTCTNYQFVDEKNKDQGINVRHRAQQIIQLLGDDAGLKFEREKAAANRTKYGGVGSDGSRSGGFGLGSASSGGGGDGSSGGFGGSGQKYGGFSSSDYASQQGATNSGYPGHAGGSSFAPAASTPPAPASSGFGTASPASAPAPPAPQPVADLLGFDDFAAAPPAQASAQPSGAFNAGRADDDWGAFTSANNAAPKPVAAAAPAPFPAFGNSPAAAPPAAFGAFGSAQPLAAQPAPASAAFVVFGTGVPLASAAAAARPAAAHDDDDFADFAMAPPPPSTGAASAGLSAITATPSASLAPTSAAQPKLNAAAPLSAFVASGLVDLDPISMLGGNKAAAQNGPSMNTMMGQQGHGPMGAMGRQSSGSTPAGNQNGFGGSFI